MCKAVQGLNAAAAAATTLCVWGNPITQNVVRVEPKKAQGKVNESAKLTSCCCCKLQATATC